jgi:hypothetical protein
MLLTSAYIATFLCCSAILALGFDDKFVRIWEYYFIYCAAGFKSRTLGNYQVRAVGPWIYLPYERSRIIIPT